MGQYSFPLSRKEDEGRLDGGLLDFKKSQGGE